MMAALETMLAIGVGSAMGALARYALSLAMNAVLPPIPLGTLASNLIAAYIVGAAIAVFAAVPGLSPNWRLFVITGLAGGLSTFSTFSAEIVALLQRGEYGWGAAVAGTHLAGSLSMTIAGFATVGWLRAH